MLFVIDQSDHRDGWRWIDYAGRAFVVERDIAASYSCAKRPAGFGDAFNGFAQLPEIFRLVRIAEVQAIRHR